MIVNIVIEITCQDSKSKYTMVLMSLVLWHGPTNHIEIWAEFYMWNKAWSWPVSALIVRGSVSSLATGWLSQEKDCKGFVGGRSIRDTSITGECDAMSRFRAGRQEKVSIVVRTGRKHLLLRWWRKGIHRNSLSFGYSELHGVKTAFWAHVVGLYPSSASSQPRLGNLH